MGKQRGRRISWEGLGDVKGKEAAANGDPYSENATLTPQRILHGRCKDDEEPAKHGSSENAKAG